MTEDDMIARLDEEQMLLGLGWREAAAITNEYLHTAYTVASRVQYAQDLATAKREKGEENAG